MSRTPLSTVPIKTEPIPPAVVEEIETFEAEAMRMVSGDVSADLFRPFRLQYGIYGQRQAGVQMVRIKIPFGGLTANQLRRVAELTEAICHRCRACDHAPGYPAAFCRIKGCADHHARAG